MSLDYSDIYIPDCWVFRRNDRGDFNGVSEAFQPRKLSITCEHWTQISHTPLFSYHDHPREPFLWFTAISNSIFVSKNNLSFFKTSMSSDSIKRFLTLFHCFLHDHSTSDLWSSGICKWYHFTFLFDFAFCRRESVLNVQSFILIVLDVAKVTSWHLWSISTERVFTVTGRLFMLGCSV